MPLTPTVKRYIDTYLRLNTWKHRRGGRAAEGPALEKRYPVKNGIVGSNPTLSAKKAVWPAINQCQDSVFKACCRSIDDPSGPLACVYNLIASAMLCGEMSELAEGARLEIVCAAKSGTEGSNPSLSATKISGYMAYSRRTSFGLVQPLSL